MMKRVYGAYGSNLNMQQMKDRCPEAKLVGTAYLKDYKLLYKGSLSGAYLTIERSEGDGLPLGIWEVSALDEKQLDRYEGFPKFYNKVEINMLVKNIKGETQEATVFIYVMNEERRESLPSEYYIKTCQQGYKDFGFDEKYLEDAYKNTEERINELDV